MRIVALFAGALFCAIPVVGQSASTGASLPGPVASLPSPPSSGRPMGIVERPLPTYQEVPSDTPVVTLDGVCDPLAPAVKTCKTVVTRGEMDNLADMLLPGALPEARRQFALRYARLLAASSVAERQHLEKNPAVANVLRTQTKFVRMQVLAGAFYHQIDQQAATIPMADIRRYYEEHGNDFAQGDLRRLSLPTTTRVPGGKTLDLKIVQGKAVELKVRALSGEDFEQLQESAYKDLGQPGPLPPTKMANIGRADLPLDQQKVFDLRPGEVSEVFDSFSGLVILKLESKRTKPLESVQSEISSILQRLRVRQELQQASQGVKAQFNPAFMGLSSVPDLFPPLGLSQKLNQPSAIPGISSNPRTRMLSRRRSLPGSTALPATSR